MTPESLKKDAQYLMEWLEKQPHLPGIKGKNSHVWIGFTWYSHNNIFNYVDEKFLIGLIQKSKNRLESTKEILEMTFTLRATIPKLMGEADISEEHYRTILKMGWDTEILISIL